MREGKGQIDIEALSFRYADDRPFLYQDFNLKSARKVVAIMGQSGLRQEHPHKLGQGFYQPSGGTIKIDGNDTATLGQRDCRHYSCVVPQETILLLRTLYDTHEGRDPPRHLRPDRACVAKWPKSTAPSKPCRKATRPKSAERGVRPLRRTEARWLLQEPHQKHPKYRLRRSHQRLDANTPTTSPPPSTSSRAKSRCVHHPRHAQDLLVDEVGENRAGGVECGG